MPRRLAFVGPYEVAILDYEDPPLEPTQIRVRTEWASGKHGTTTVSFDRGAVKGQTFLQDMRIFGDSDESPRVPTPESPWATGGSGVGTVIEVGSDRIQPVISLDEGAEVFRAIRDAPDTVLKYAVRF